MKTLATIALLAAIALATAAPASASIDRKYAANVAWLKAADWADSKQWQYGDWTDIDLTRSDCRHTSRRIWKCTGTVTFEEYVEKPDSCYDSDRYLLPSECYEDDYARTGCDVYIKIRVMGWATRETLTGYCY